MAINNPKMYERAKTFSEVFVDNILTRRGHEVIEVSELEDKQHTDRRVRIHKDKNNVWRVDVKDREKKNLHTGNITISVDLAKEIFGIPSNAKLQEKYRKHALAALLYNANDEPSGEVLFIKTNTLKSYHLKYHTTSKGKPFYTLNLEMCINCKNIITKIIS